MKQKILSFGSPRRAAPDRAKAAAANSQRRKRRRTGRQTLNYILILLAAAVVMVVLSLTVFFKIEKLEVTGTTKYAVQEIIDTSGVKIGDNLFCVSEKGVTRRLAEKYPYVEAVNLKRTFPPKLTIEITQAKVLGAVASDDGYVVIGQNGKILETGAQTLPEGTTAITGMYLSDHTVGRILGEISQKGEIVAPEEQFASSEETSSQKAASSSEDAKVDPKKLDKQRRERAATVEKDGYAMLKSLVDAVEETGFERITLVDFTDRLNMLLVYDNRVMIELGSQANLPYKLKFAQKVIEDELEPTFQGILDVSIDKEVWVDPCSIEQELQKRRLNAMKAAQEDSGEYRPPAKDSPELEVIPGSASSSKPASSEAQASSASEPPSSFDPLEVIPNDDMEQPESSSQATSAEPQKADEQA
ncbi:cell division protein FtsQ/DivIB [Anaerotruncus rubiinfantis]|uniref:cell division protein FtsQ/DivIB n=1 Tax=Anaerotruncus rubiinfantis TaxID=1720200 RepID=UPI001897EBDD|nr:FtsQ-type POTRA domain-containing protein [Anaerotruncus rubiinfantis]